MDTPRILGKRGSERGSVLITAIMVIVVMLLISIPFLFRLSGASRSAERGAKALAALNLAEAGIDKVIWDVNRDYTSTPVYDPTQDPERIVPINATDGAINNIKTSDSRVEGNIVFTLGADPDPGGMGTVSRPLVSTGRVPFLAGRTVNRTVQVTLEKYFGSAFDYGFVVTEHFRITNTQLTVDSYDSSVANYDPQNQGDMGYFACLNPDPNSFIVDQGGGGTIDVTGALAAGGNALLDNDPSNDPTAASADAAIDLPKQLDDSITQLPMQQPFNLPDVNVLTLNPRPTWPQPTSIANWFDATTFTGARGEEIPLQGEVLTGFRKGSVTISGTQNFTDQQNGVYNSLELAPGSTLNITGDVTLYVTGYGDAGATPGSFIMGADSKIGIADGATLTLILGWTSCYLGQMTAINVPLVGTVDEPGTPADCVILGTKAFTPTTEYSGDLTQKQGLDIQKDPRTSPVGAVVFEQQSDISAAIYTPGAQIFDIQGMNHADIYGAWIAKTMIYKVAAGFHYDTALGDFMMIPGGPAKWRVSYWREKVGD